MSGIMNHGVIEKNSKKSESNNRYVLDSDEDACSKARDEMEIREHWWQLGSKVMQMRISMI